MPNLSDLFSAGGFLKWDGAGNADADYSSQTPAQLAADAAFTGAFVGVVTGLTGDGTTDDSAAIQAAVTAAAAATDGPARVVLPAGTFAIDTRIEVADNVQLVGQGIAKTTIKPIAGLATGAIVALGAATASDVVVSDLTIDMSTAPAGTKAIQMTSATRVRVQRVKVTSAPDVGMIFVTCADVKVTDCDITAVSDGVRINTGSTDCGVYTSKIRSSAGKCVLVASASLRCRVESCDLAITGATGQECVGVEDDCHDAWVLHNHCTGSVDDNCIGVTGNRSHIIGNTVTTTGKHGISVGDGTAFPVGIVVQGNVVEEAGTKSDVAYGGIVLQAATGAIVTGNRVTSADEYGIKGTSEDYCVIANNDLRGNVTAPLSLTGANNIVHDNQGITDSYLIRKAADETVNNSSTLQDDNELTFAVGANETWVGEVVLFVQGDATADIKVGLTAPTSSAVVYAAHASRAADAVMTADQFTTTAGTAGVHGANTTGTSIVVRFSVAVAGTAGSVTVQWAQVAATAANTTVKAGSVLKANRI